MDTKTRRVWAGLVNYANDTASYPQVRSTVADCMGWISAGAPFGLLDGVFGGEDQLKMQAAEYRPAVDRLLRFLCSGSEENRSLWDARQFLFEHGRHVGGMHFDEVLPKEQVEKSLQGHNYTAAELADFKKQSEMIWVGQNLLPLGLWVPTKDYQDLADPICDFLMSEYQKYLNREYSRVRIDKDSAPIVPIFVCPRCNKLVMPERTGRKQYCSDCTDRARAEKYRQKAPADERKDYQWLYRLRDKEPALRKMFLRSPKNQARLKQVKSRQKESSRCQALFQEMHL